MKSSSGNQIHGFKETKDVYAFLHPEAAAKQRVPWVDATQSRENKPSQALARRRAGSRPKMESQGWALPVPVQGLGRGYTLCDPPHWTAPLPLCLGPQMTFPVGYQSREAGTLQPFQRRYNTCPTASDPSQPEMAGRLPPRTERLERHLGWQEEGCRRAEGLRGTSLRFEEERSSVRRQAGVATVQA